MWAMVRLVICGERFARALADRVVRAVRASASLRGGPAASLSRRAQPVTARQPDSSSSGALRGGSPARRGVVRYIAARPQGKAFPPLFAEPLWICLSVGAQNALRHARVRPFRASGDLLGVMALFRFIIYKL